MTKQLFDGSQYASDLLSRINSEDRVGDSLASDTINLYALKMRHIASRWTEGNVSALSPEMVVRDLNDRVANKKITQVTARVEKSAALFWIAEQAQAALDSGSHEFGRYELAYRDIQTLSTNELPKKSINTSGQKAKAFPDDALAILNQEMVTNKQISLQHAMSFIRANLHVGLRPVEWFTAELTSYHHKDGFGDPKYRDDGSLDTSPALEVVNAKRSSIRGNGDVRIILLDNLDAKAINHIREWMGIVDEIKSKELMQLSEADLTKKVYDGLQRTIRRILKAHDWKGAMPTIYSTRHQAVANARADGRTQQEIAALFGHSSTDTARRHYGRKNAGYTGRSMRAAPESILAVRSTVAVSSPEVTWSDAPSRAAQPARK